MWNTKTPILSSRPYLCSQVGFLTCPMKKRIKLLKLTAKAHKIERDFAEGSTMTRFKTPNSSLTLRGVIGST